MLGRATLETSAKILPTSVHFRAHPLYPATCASMFISKNKMETRTSQSVYPSNRAARRPSDDVCGVCQWLPFFLPGKMASLIVFPTFSMTLPPLTCTSPLASWLSWGFRQSSPEWISDLHFLCPERDDSQAATASSFEGYLLHIYLNVHARGRESVVLFDQLFGVTELPRRV